MMDLFFEKKEFFHIKEMEKLAPKLKGISKYAHSVAKHAIFKAESTTADQTVCRPTVGE